MNSKTAAGEEMVVDRSAFEVIGLLPAAPQELVVEAYWHLAFHLQRAAETDSNAQAMLVRLNRAYEVLVSSNVQAGNGNPTHQLDERRKDAGVKRVGWLGRVLRHSPEGAVAAPSQWEALQVSPSAPREVVELAYEFWRRRLGRQPAHEAGPALEAIENAYVAAIEEIADASASENSVASAQPDRPEESDERHESDAGDGYASATHAVVNEEIGTIPDAEALEEAGSGSESRSWRSRIRTGVVAASASAKRWMTGVMRAGWEWFLRWGADPFHEYDPNAVQTPEPEVDADASWRADELPADLLGVGARIGAAPPEPSSRSDEAADLRAHQDGRISSVGSGMNPRAELSMPPRPKSSVVPAAVLGVKSQLVAEDGETWVIGERALSIGTDQACDIVARLVSPDSPRVTARLWCQDERVMLHVLEQDPPVLINSTPTIWALLEDGDVLQIEGITLRFECPVTGEER
ncbi:MAG: hypothetical protein IH865_09865 [Chloroflexi bacterium]|nr:hypothetical protein [Chloroflexota bacterium]